MNLPFRIARRYLFAKKSTHAINIISGIAVLGIVVGTAAIVLILSVFNGFEDLIKGLYGSFNPDIKITLKEGKVFSPDSAQIKQIQGIKGVEAVSKTLSEVAFFEYGQSQDFGILKGVDTWFDSVSKVDENIMRGRYLLETDSQFYAVVGAGMEYKLSLVVGEPTEALAVYMPKRSRGLALPNETFKRRFLFPSGVFAIQQDFDDRFVLTSLSFTQDLLSYRDEIDALEVKIAPNADPQRLLRKIKTIMGSEFLVKNRYQQEEAFFKLMNMEKWMAYAVISFALLLLAFNVVGALWMLVLEKQSDIAILKSMGATDAVIRNIFLIEGLILAFLGAMIGFLLALFIYFLQVTVGIIRLAGSANLLIDTYPISLKFSDFALVFLTVMVIGLIAAWLPSLRAKRIPPIIREV